MLRFLSFILAFYACWSLYQLFLRDSLLHDGPELRAALLALTVSIIEHAVFFRRRHLERRADV